MHQFQFENHKPYYPQDFPWSYDGWQYNKLVGEANQIKAAKLPKVKFQSSSLKRIIQ